MEGEVEMREVLRMRIVFPTLSSGSGIRLMHPLRALSPEEWEEMIQGSSEEERSILSSVFPAHTLPTASLLCERMKRELTFEQWKKILRFQNVRTNPPLESTRYVPDHSILSHSMHRALFPLGVEEAHAQDFGNGVLNSGFFAVEHKKSKLVTRTVYGLMGSGLAFLLLYMGLLSHGPNWKLAATFHNLSSTDYREEVDARTRQRGQFASLLNAATFSLTVNACLDKFGKIDPSTSTVLIGMGLGGTWGFILDNLFRSDEGFREYLWDTSMGMKYALGSLATFRFSRYMITVFFDMFFTVILFRQLYPSLVRISGFSATGREWIANGWISGFISVLTFQVYANTTRFSWAYPSGEEKVFDRWITGDSMLFATIIMCMVYLTTETRLRDGERGINDPGIKLFVTLLVFFGLALLQIKGGIDPSHKKGQAFEDSLLDPLPGCCDTILLWGRGLLIFLSILCFCLSSVIFGTAKAKFPLFEGREKEALLSKLLLFLCFFFFVIFVLLFFWTVPLFRRGEEYGERFGGCPPS